MSIFSPVAWTFSGRNGNGAWHVLDTQSGHNSWADGEIKSFDTACPAPFRVLVCATRTLNVKGQSRVTLSLQ